LKGLAGVGLVRRRKAVLSHGLSSVADSPWKNEHEELMDSIIAGREGADAHVAKSLYHRATGYSHPAEKIAFGKDGETMRADYVERYPPDAASAIFWLKNRRRHQWRDTPAVSVGIQATGTNVSVTMNTSELSQGYLHIISGDE
jgi:hypothetical protein